MLAAHMDLGVRYKMAGPQQRASAELRGLRIETRVTLGDQKARDLTHITHTTKALLCVPAHTDTCDWRGSAGCRVQAGAGFRHLFEDSLQWDETHSMHTKRTA